jgi:hypothetical protein
MRRAKPSLLAGPSGKSRCLKASVKIRCERKEAAGRRVKLRYRPNWCPTWFAKRKTPTWEQGLRIQAFLQGLAKNE